MTMFGKDYDAEIAGINNSINQILEMLPSMLANTKELMKDSMQQSDQMIELAKNAACQKECIEFLLGHCVLAEGSQEDLLAMLNKLKEINKAA